jgi:hypothetical protein
MKLYIANCSKQEFQFTYGLLENPRPFMQKIRAGAQIVIEGQPEELDYILRQHEPYGFQDARSVKKGFGGIAFQFDKPISVSNIEQGISQRDQEAIDRALEARKITAAAADQQLSQKAEELGLQQKSGLEIEILEEKRNAADSDSKFEETIEVVKEGLAPRKSKSRKG